jgi:hypothetical protein
VVKIHNVVFWIKTHCSPVGEYYFGGKYSLRMEAVCSSETVILTYQPTQCHQKTAIWSFKKDLSQI